MLFKRNTKVETNENLKKNSYTLLILFYIQS